MARHAIFSARRLLAAVPLAVWIGGCAVGEDPVALENEPPLVAYVAGACDTVGVQAHHPPVETGGSTRRFKVKPQLPPGFALDTAGGLISGTPTAPRAPMSYTVIVTGPGGADTTSIRLCVVPASHSAAQAPWIAYDSPAVDTITVPATRAPVSLGGQVTSYALVAPASPPAGLSFDPATGVFSGTPTTLLGFETYTVVATGPAGQDTATFQWAVLPKADAPLAGRPVIGYQSPRRDTIGSTVAYPVVSAGGKVTSYSLLAGALPSGLKLNSVTGLISGTLPNPLVVSGDPPVFLPKTHLSIYPGNYTSTASIVAKGPGGRDTAEIVIEVVWPGYETPVYSSGVLLMAELVTGNIPLSKAVVTFTSSVSTDTVVRDTLLSVGSGLLKGLLTYPAGRSYALKPLRHWRMQVRSLDANDSVIHQDSAEIASLKAGETRLVTVSTAPRLAAYALRFNLSDSVTLTGLSGYVQQQITRVVMRSGARVLLDTSTAFSSSALNAPFIRYMPLLGDTTVSIEMYGRVGGPAAPSLLYVGTSKASRQATLGTPEAATLSPVDGWTPANVPAQFVKLGGLVVIEPPLPPVVLPKMRRW